MKNLTLTSKKFLFTLLLASTAFPGLVLGDTTSDNQLKSNQNPASSNNIVLKEETKNELKDVLVNVVENAVQGEIHDVINYLSESDRERINKQDVTNKDSLKNSSESFTANWKKSHNSSFNDMFDRNSLEVVEINGISENTANVKITDGKSSVVVKLVNQGVLMDSWKIDAPDSLTINDLQNKTNEVLNSENNAHELAFRILSTLGNITSKTA